VIQGLSVRENLLLGGYSLSHRDRLRRFGEIIELFPLLAPLLDIPAGLLSGGQQQETVLARSLMPRPDLMLVDEPMLGLDAVNRLNLASLLTDVWRRGTSLLIAEHRTDDLVSYVTHSVVIGAQQ
jgi:branched-chain amino acid transport system ATP-binding protein